MRRPGLLVSLVLLGGCGTAVTPITVEMACGEGATAYCAKVNTCAPLFLTNQYVDLAACQARFALGCKLSMGAPDTAQTPANLSTCAAALGASSCDDLFSGKSPASCKPVMGKIADGLACGDDSQCASAFCTKQRGMTCGACGPRPVAGADCTKVECGGQGLTCADNSRCVTTGTVGQMCDANHPCISSLGCQGATMTTMGTCVAPLGTVGMACDPDRVTTPPCDLIKGLVCNPMATPPNTCDTILQAGTGEPCGYVNKKLVVCKASGRCTKPFPQMGTCLAAAADGAACDAAMGPDCTPPAHCVNSACKIDDPVNCK